MATASPQELQAVKAALDQDPLNAGVGILHEPTGRIYLRPFDQVPGGHAQLAGDLGLPLSECRGFGIGKAADGAFVPVNSSHLNGPQGVPGSLQMPPPTFAEVVRALQAAGLSRCPFQLWRSGSMPQAVAPQDRAVVERLLNELARRADGAIDFWTTVCLSPEGLLPAPGDFVAANGEVLRSFAVCLRAILAEAGLRGEPVRGLLAALPAACRQLEEAMLLLARFRTVPLADVRAAARSMAEAHAALLTAVQALGEALGCSVAYCRQRTGERERYYQQILDGLFELFRAAHPSGGGPEMAGSTKSP